MKAWKVVDLVTDVFAVLAAILPLLVALSVSYSVTLRYLHFEPPIWILQFTEYALLWITFLGAPWVLRIDGHVRIDTFVMMFRPGVRRALNLLVALAGTSVCLVIVWFGAEKTLDLYRRGIMDVKGISVPEYPLFVIIPLGSALLALQFGKNVFDQIKPKAREGGGAG